jgi:hypothetical protein
VSAMTETSMNAWNGYCGDAIRLRNRRMLMRTIWLIGIGSLFIWLHPHLGDVGYWTLFLRGPGAGGGEYFSVELHRNQAGALLSIEAVFLSLGAYTGQLYVRRRLDFMRHPFARDLALRGPIEEVTAEIDAQFSKAHEHIDKVVLTTGWLLYETRWKVIPMRHADMVWVFQRATSTDSGIFQAMIRDRFGKTIEPDYLTIKEKAKFLKRVLELAPQAIQGYDKQIDELWSSGKDNSSFPETVRSLYPDRPTTGVRQL